VIDLPLRKSPVKHLTVALKDDRRGLALLSKLPPSIALIFVHGFWGKPRSTWVDFCNLIEDDPKWNDCDVYFYGHRSNKQVRTLADKFLPFLQAVAAGGRQVLGSAATFPSNSPSLFGPGATFWSNRGTEPYKRIILVGHSAGALIIRETLNLIINSALQSRQKGKLKVSVGEQMILDSKVRFFAPAHKGFLGAGILGVAQNVPVIDIIPTLCLQWNPLYQNIAKQVVVQAIQDETEKFWKAYKISALNALSVFGQNEQIVNIGKYSHEAKERTEPGKHHTSICKPRPDFLFPVGFVTDVI
jgi:hypothetical protein